MVIPAPDNQTLLHYLATDPEHRPTILSVNKLENKENEPTSAISPFLIEPPTSLPYLAPSNRTRVLGDYKIYNDVYIGNKIVDIAVNLNIINPYGGYLSGIVEYEPRTPSIRFYERFPLYCFCIRLRRNDFPSVGPRRLASWISTSRAKQYNNVAKLIRDVLPELFDKPLRLHSRVIASSDYYVESDDYRSGVP